MKPHDYIPEGAERRFFSAPVTRMEQREDGTTVVKGVAALFNDESEDLGGFREIIMPGAFDGVMQDDVRALFNHDRNIVLGRTKSNTLRLRQTSKGLEYEYDSPDTQAARDLLVSIERGDVSQSSFAFFIDQQEWDEPEEPGQAAIRKIIKVRRLLDVSPVTYPGYTNTEVAKRSLDQWHTEHSKGSGIELRRRRIEIAEKHQGL